MKTREKKMFVKEDKSKIECEACGAKISKKHAISYDNDGYYYCKPSYGCAG